MTVQEIANRLVELCRKGEWDTCYQELYSPNARSIEPEGTPDREIQGMEAFKTKGEKWQSMVKEVHKSEIGDPVVAGNHFSLAWKTNLTFQGAPGPTDMDEICVYEVEDGKIVKEQFFYPKMG